MPPAACKILLASLVLLEWQASAFLQENDKQQTGSVLCVDGWLPGHATGSAHKVMASSATLSKEACADLVKNGNAANCSSANGATQFVSGGCYCQFNMDELIDNHDGTYSCLFSGDWINKRLNFMLISAVLSGVGVSCCCCWVLFFYRIPIYKRLKAIRKEKTGHEQTEDFLALGKEKKQKQRASIQEFLEVAPDYWTNQDLSKDFDARHPPSPETQAELSKMLLSTWKDVEQSVREDGSMIPVGLSILEIIQVENRDLWIRYLKGKARIQERRTGGVATVGVKKKEKKATVQGPAGATVGHEKHKRNPFHNKAEHSAASAHGECKTSAASSPLMTNRLDHHVNEYYLLHGTSPEGAFGILDAGFKLSFVGSHKGTLFGRGCYFAESSSKADETATPGQGELEEIYGMLVCRVICGELFRMNYSDHKLVEKALDSDFYDAVLGDREAEVGTYREYVIFNEDVVYPEYIILYKRQYLTE